MTIPDVHGLDSAAAAGRLTTVGLGVALVTQRISTGRRLPPAFNFAATAADTVASAADRPR